MLYIIPIAGRSSRFSDINLNVPKWAIKLQGKFVLERAINSIPFINEDKLVIIALKEHEFYLRSILKSFESTVIPEIFFLNVVVPGQALTVATYLRSEVNKADQPICIWCGDSFIEKTALEDIPRSGNWLTLAKLDGNSWSFAKIEKMQVTKTAEKIRISEWASVGLYGFQSAEVFIEALDEFMLSNTGKIEAYVAPLYNFIKFEVYPHYIDMTEFNCAGTPSELNALVVKNKWNVEIYPEQFKD